MSKNHNSAASRASKKYKDFRYLNTTFIPCYYCGRPLDRQNATTEHITPLFNGRNNKQDNLAICCQKCNTNHSAILSANINLTKLPNSKSNIKAVSKHRLMLSQREKFWAKFNSFTIFNFLEKEKTFGDEDIITYYNAAYYYSGTYSLNNLNLSDKEKNLILSRFDTAFP